MPHISQIKQSKYLSKEDVGNGLLLTMAECTQENLAMQGSPAELKWVLHFDEVEKPLVLNSLNAQLIAKITGNEQTENWVGQKVVLYVDPTVQMQGRLVGGIRVRAPRVKAAAQPAPAPRPVPPPAPRPESLAAEQAGPDDEDLPF